MARIEAPTILVIVGVSGDLSRRKLLPAIRQIARAGQLPKHFRIVGVSRRDLTKHEVMPAGETAELEKLLETYHMDLDNSVDYHRLGEHLESIEKKFGAEAQYLFYLSVPPQVTRQVVSMLGDAGLLRRHSSKLLLEKPFGTDLETAEELVEYLVKHCREEQIYRIDHYLAKEMAQNLIVFRMANSLFQQTWSTEFIESIDVYASETIGIEGRAAFYQQTGALRDFLQSHLLQLAALVLMDLPDSPDARDDIPERRLKALQALRPPTNLPDDVTRGQYIGYREEVGVSDSMVETYVQVRLYSDDPRWADVPITLTTGKAMNTHRTEIRVRYRAGSAAHGNELVLRIQPDEGVTLHFWIKQPGYEHELQPLPLVLAYDHHFAGLPDAYERVFVDAMSGDHSLFATSAEVLASWRLVAPIQHAWNMHDDDLILYAPGHDPAP